MSLASRLESPAARFFLGHPARLLEELGEGRVLSPGGLLHHENVLWPHGDAGAKAVHLALPALSGAQAYAQQPWQPREQRVARGLGTALGSAYGGAGLGLTGSLVGAHAGGRLGDVLGRSFTGRMAGAPPLTNPPAPTAVTPPPLLGEGGTPPGVPGGTRPNPITPRTENTVKPEAPRPLPLVL